MGEVVSTVWNVEKNASNSLLSSRTLLAIISAVTELRNSEPGLPLMSFLLLRREMKRRARMTTECETWAVASPRRIVSSRTTRRRPTREEDDDAGRLTGAEQVVGEAKEALRGLQLLLGSLYCRC